jgi:cellulose biosynthesis protein BcsQ
MSDRQPFTISFVSGKGGVGKTMLAVAFAREMSTQKPTLLLDLDFFNRGLTGLMRHGRKLQAIAPPTFVKNALPALNDGWELVEIAPNLVHLRYPDLTPEQIRDLEQADVDELAQSLRSYLTYLQAASGCAVIVMDCHGGPDQLSFAACIVSNHSLLVSEPDKITFYGTLHFARQLESSTRRSNIDLDLRLVFNKVVPAFSLPYLTQFYNREVKRLFNNRDLLAVFPLEIYLTKEFERTPFLTAVYPFSQLAKKIRALIYDLLGQQRPDGRTPSKLSLWFTRHSMGRLPSFIDLNRAIVVIAMGCIIAIIFGFYVDKIIGPRYRTLENNFVILQKVVYVREHPKLLISRNCTTQDWESRLLCLDKESGRDFPVGYMYLRWDLELSPVSQINALLQNHDLERTSDPLVSKAYKYLREHPLGRFDLVILQVDYFMSRSRESSSVWSMLGRSAVIWFVSCLVLNWSITLDRQFTYFIRMGQRLSSFMLFLAVLGIWCVPLSLVGTIATSFREHWTLRAWLIACFLFAGVGVGDQFSKTHYNLRFEGRKIEGCSRILFIICTIVIPLISFVLQRSWVRVILHLST